MLKRCHQDPVAQADTIEQPATRRRRTIKRQLRESYTYTRLADPEKQIRLLRFIPDENEQCISLEMSTWDIGTTPGYIAISYTWGSRRYKDIWVNGKALRVRKNSLYALWQTRLHNPDAYVWMDAVCIAQCERKEKGHQVKIMGSIFEYAQKVVACVGEADATSELVMDMARYGPLNRSAHDSQLWWKGRLAAEVYEKVAEFLNRPYFSRLWIVQEVAASGGRLDFLCGSRVVSKDGFDYLLDSCKDPDAAVLLTSEWSYSAMRNCRLRERALNQAFLMSGHRECHDLRDRVYAVLSLIKWDARGPLISPNYSITPMDLALDVCEHCDATSTESLLRALGISAREPKFQTWISERMGVGAPTYLHDETQRALTFVATCLR